MDYASGTPGTRSAITATPIALLLTAGSALYLPTGSRVIDGTKTADAGNTPDVDILRAGLVMGKVTSSGKYSNSIVGLTGGALTSTGTSLTIPAEVSTELARRVGATGTFKLTGPPTAGGTVRTLTATYSALGATTATITALGVNEVQTVTFPIASTGGSVALMLWDPRTSQYVQVPAATWSATDATYLAAIQAKLDLAFGAANIVVVSAKAATDTDSALVFTWSGTGVAATPCTDAGGTAKLPIVTTLPTSSTSYATERTTSGVDGRFVTGSLIQPTDGSETPLGLLNHEYGLKVTDVYGTRADQPLAKMLIGGAVRTSKIVNFPADTSTRTWLVNLLNATGSFTFDHTV